MVAREENRTRSPLPAIIGKPVAGTGQLGLSEVGPTSLSPEVRRSDRPSVLAV